MSRSSVLKSRLATLYLPVVVATLQYTYYLAKQIFHQTTVMNIHADVIKTSALRNCTTPSSCRALAASQLYTNKTSQQHKQAITVQTATQQATKTRCRTTTQRPATP